VGVEGARAETREKEEWVSTKRDRLTRRAAAAMEIAPRKLRIRWWQLSAPNRARMGRSLEQALAGSPREQLRLYLLVRDFLAPDKREEMDRKHGIHSKATTPKPRAVLDGATADR